MWHGTSIAPVVMWSNAVRNPGFDLVESQLKHGDTLEEMMAVIAQGVPGTTMAGWNEKLSPQQIKLLAIYISEQRQKFPTTSHSHNGTRR